MQKTEARCNSARLDDLGYEYMLQTGDIHHAVVLFGYSKDIADAVTVQRPIWLASYNGFMAAGVYYHILSHLL